MTNNTSYNANIGFFDVGNELCQKEKPYVCLVPLAHAPDDFSRQISNWRDTASW